jgi:hypothetical protein
VQPYLSWSSKVKLHWNIKESLLQELYYIYLGLSTLYIWKFSFQFFVWFHGNNIIFVLACGTRHVYLLLQSFQSWVQIFINIILLSHWRNSWFTDRKLYNNKYNKPKQIILHLLQTAGHILKFHVSTYELFFDFWLRRWTQALRGCIRDGDCGHVSANIHRVFLGLHHKFTKLCLII